MHPGQYIPYSYSFGKTPLIIYPVKDEHPLDEIFTVDATINAHLNELYAANAGLLGHGSYHILFVWNLDGQRMTDVWIHDMDNWSATSGPLLECVTFRGLERCADAGIASGDSILALGREEELRRDCASLEDYLDRSKHVPVFPEGAQPDETFFS